MSKVLIFAGTSEGRTVAEYLNANKISCHVCVATQYGESLLPEGQYIAVTAKRLTAIEMESLLSEVSPELVIDATHPYAATVTENITNACQKMKVEYVRLLRQEHQAQGGNIVNVASIKEAVEFLNQTEGDILTTTGSKELAEYTKVDNYQERVYARVLSLPEVVQDCAQLGFVGKHLICMQGPFSKELNQAMINQLGIKWLVSKEAGDAGGFDEKCVAVLESNCNMVLVGRPSTEVGISLADCQAMLRRRFAFSPKQQIAIVGIGMGAADTLTIAAQRAIEKGQVIIGAKRMVEAVVRPGQATYEAYRPDVISDYIKEHQEYQNIVIVLSGDVGFYSGAKKLLAVLPTDVELVSGISSLVYFCAKLKTTWEDVYTCSRHGRNDNIVGLIQKNPKVFAIVGQEMGIGELCQKMNDYGLGDVKIAIGERLSYPDEQISVGLVRDFIDYQTDSLAVFLIENEKANSRIVTQGIEDHQFIRDKVPMTKAEIRSISLSKLQLNEDSLVYDIGAGTGSVAIEMARLVTKGYVYAIEKKDVAIELLKRNKQKFAIDNLAVVEGLAPAACVDLPRPTHAFIGGSSGNLREIIQLLLDKNPQVRIVINCITLETLSEALLCVKELPVINTDIVQVTIGKAQVAGDYHLMMGQNPVSIISCQGGPR